MIIDADAHYAPETAFDNIQDKEWLENYKQANGPFFCSLIDQYHWSLKNQYKLDRQLLNYFGQDVATCGKCDVCQQELREGQKASNLRNEIIEFLIEPKSQNEFDLKFGYNNDVILKLVRSLLHEGIVVFENTTYSLKK